MNYRTREDPPVPSLAVLFGSLFAAAAALVGGTVLYRQHRRLWRSDRTTGRVVSSAVEPRTTPWSRWWPGRAAEVVRVEDGERADADVEYRYRGGGKPALEPAVEYEYRVGGRQYANDTVWAAGFEPSRRRLPGGAGESAETVVERFPEGEPVTVYYDPDDPADAFLLRERNWMLPVVCFVFVVALAVWAAHCTGVVFVPVGEFSC